MKKAFHVALLGFIGLVLLGCGGAAEPDEIVIEVSEQGYLPSEVTVAAGKIARLTLRNVGTEEHDLGIREIPLVTSGEGDTMAGHNMDSMSGQMPIPLQLHIAAAEGVSSSLDFTPSVTGEYEFRCQIAGHNETGTLVVVRSSE